MNPESPDALELSSVEQSPATDSLTVGSDPPQLETVTPLVLPESMLASYAVLFQHRSLDNDVLWRIIAFSVAAEAGALLALLSDKLNPSPALIVLIGVGTLAVGVAGPLTIRFVETSVMIDRQLLDVYEGVMFPHGAEVFRQWHGLRLSARFTKVRSLLTEERREVLDRRRFAKAGSTGWRVRLDRFADLVGQPSLVWTAVIAAGGAIGFSVAVRAAGVYGWVWIFLTVLGFSLTSTLWFIAGEGHKVPARAWKRLRKSNGRGLQ